MDTIRKVTLKFDNEFEQWIRRTKVHNRFHPEKLKYHRAIRKALMDILGEEIKKAPPIDVERIRNRPKNSKRFRYRGSFKGDEYSGTL